MTVIFSYTDNDDDTLNVNDRDKKDLLAFRIPPVERDDGEGRGVDLLRDQVLELHAALGEWLYPVHTPEGPNRSLIEQMIERAVKDQITAVLPLHLTPFATQMQAAEDKIGRIANALTTDPEPGDIGHPGPPERPCPHSIGWGASCSTCQSADNEPQHDGPRPASSPSVHAVAEADCTVPDGCGAQHLGGIHGRLMSELPRRVRPSGRLECSCGHVQKTLHSTRGCTVDGCPCVWPGGPWSDWEVVTSPRCPECRHPWAEHTSGLCWGIAKFQERDADNGCGCTRERPE